jgi:hypothetical protein
MSPLSGVLTETWALYRRYAAHFLLIAFAIYLVTAVLVALLSLAGAFGYFLGAIIDLTAVFLLQAALVKAVQDVRDGRVDLNLSQTIQAAVPYLLPVAAAGILAAIAIVIGFALIIVPGLILLTFLCLIVPFIVIGETGPIDAFSKSWQTVRGYAWNVFGTLVLVFLLYLAFIIVLNVILLFLPGYLRSFVSSVVVGTLVAPFFALVITLIYYRLTAAHASRAYTSTGPAPTTVWEPPYPTTPADSTAARTAPPATATPTPPPAPPTPPGPSGPTTPGPRDATLPYSTSQEPPPPAPTEPEPEPGPATPPESPPPPPSTP